MSPTRRRSSLALALVLSVMTLARGALAEPIDDERKLSAFEVREDLELAISAVEAALPDIYFHQSRRDWNRAKRDARERASTVTDSEALWRILRPLLARIGEGHLSLQRSDAMNAAWSATPRFPLDLLWTEEGAFVLSGYGDAADVPAGARLVSVDGVDEPTLVREIVSVTPHDGVIQTGAMRDVSGRGFTSALYRLRGPQSVFRVEYEDAAGRHTRDLPAVAASVRPQPTPEGSPLPTLEWLDDHTAYLVVPTFSNRRINETGTTFPDAIHAAFQTLEQRGARDLILDLRENGGGSEPNEAILFSYLVEQPLHRYARVEARGQHISVRSLSGRTFETDVFDAEDLPGQRRLWNDRLTRRNAPPLGLMSHWTPSSPVFKGRLVVLAGGNTFSGGAELASMLYHVQRGVFVGEEVGGTHEGNTSGYSWDLELPNSHMNLRIPLLLFRMNWPGLPRDRGVQPDCPAPPLALEQGQPRDRAWRLARDLLTETWRSPNEAVCPPNQGISPSPT